MLGYATEPCSAGFSPESRSHAGSCPVFSLPVAVVDLLTLASAQPRCITHSERARITMGFGSIAEGCALAALGPQAQLMGARLAGDGVTCAFASVPSEILTP